MTELPPQIFDRTLLRRRRDRCSQELPQYNFLAIRAFEDICDRLASVTRNFNRALIMGGGPGLDAVLQSSPAAGKIGWLARTDLSGAIAANLPAPSFCADEERLPIGDGSIDLVLAPMGLHWTNDLPGVLVQIRRALAPDGFFAAAMPGGASLTELRQSLLAAETEITGGAHPRVSPFAGTFDFAGLLQRAGFAMPVADIDRFTVRYDTMFDLMRDLQGMGETNIQTARSRKPATRRLLVRAAEIYAERFSDEDGRIRASFELVHAAGWSPHPGQPKPKRPGSATYRLADALGATEQSLGEKAPGGGNQS